MRRLLSQRIRRDYYGAVWYLNLETPESPSRLSTIPYLLIFHIKGVSIATSSKPDRKRTMQRSVAWLSRTAGFVGEFLLVSTLEFIQNMKNQGQHMAPERNLGWYPLGFKRSILEVVSQSLGPKEVPCTSLTPHWVHPVSQTHSCT